MYAIRSYYARLETTADALAFRQGAQAKVAHEVDALEQLVIAAPVEVLAGNLLAQEVLEPLFPNASGGVVLKPEDLGPLHEVVVFLFPTADNRATPCEVQPRIEPLLVKTSAEPVKPAGFARHLAYVAHRPPQAVDGTARPSGPPRCPGKLANTAPHGNPGNDNSFLDRACTEV